MINEKYRNEIEISNIIHTQNKSKANTKPTNSIVFQYTTGKKDSLKFDPRRVAKKRQFK